jgi:hypothetical protein
MGYGFIGSDLVVVVIADRDKNRSNHGLPIYEYMIVFGKIQGVSEQEIRCHGR